ncbi:phosphopantetheine-binding protein [Corynebacterium resistens]
MDDIPTCLHQLIDQIRETLGSPNEPLAADDDLFTADLDSIRLMHLTDRWAQAGATVDPMALLDEPTPAGFWDALQGASKTT